MNISPALSLLYVEVGIFFTIPFVCLFVFQAHVYSEGKDVYDAMLNQVMSFLKLTLTDLLKRFRRIS